MHSLLDDIFRFKLENIIALTAKHHAKTIYLAYLDCCGFHTSGYYTEVRCALASSSPVQRNHAHLKLTSSPLPERGRLIPTELSNNNNNNKPFQCASLFYHSLGENYFLFTYIFKYSVLSYCCLNNVRFSSNPERELQPSPTGFHT